MNTDDRNREEAIREHFPLVRVIAKRVRRLVPSVDLDDLIGDGSIGLIRAVDAFDPKRGPSLKQYARRLIIGAMLNGIRRMDRVPERARRAVREAERIRYRLAVERGAMPTAADMENVRPGHLQAAAVTLRNVPLSLDAALPDGESLPMDAKNDPATIVTERWVRDDVHQRMAALSPRQRAVLLGHYFGGCSLRQIGARMSISAQRASQLHICALKRLRKAYYAAPH